MNTSIMSTAVPPPPKAHTGHDSVNATDESIPAFAGMTPATRSGITSARIERVFFKLLILLLSVYKPAREEDHPFIEPGFPFCTSNSSTQIRNYGDVFLGAQAAARSRFALRRCMR